jgi:hypothetical protein
LVLDVVEAPEHPGHIEAFEHTVREFIEMIEDGQMLLLEVIVSWLPGQAALHLGRLGSSSVGLHHF